MNTVKVLGELVDILKDIGSVEMFEEGVNINEEEYSFNNSYGRNGGYSQRRPMYYTDGNSYRSNYMNNGYSRRGGRGGYSRDDSKHYMIEKLNNLMNETNDSADREAISKLISQMENK
ncbi:MAG: hypothetical protein J6N21_16690 [Butyrivibrio sp.]|nr:hypothetical protein [Butyrivibrio sp.]